MKPSDQSDVACEILSGQVLRDQTSVTRTKTSHRGEIGEKPSNQSDILPTMSSDQSEIAFKIELKHCVATPRFAAQTE